MQQAASVSRIASAVVVHMKGLESAFHWWLYATKLGRRVLIRDVK